MLSDKDIDQAYKDLAESEKSIYALEKASRDIQDKLRAERTTYAKRMDYVRTIHAEVANVPIEKGKEPFPDHIDSVVAVRPQKR